jgi:hypothetical protein
MSAKHSVDGQSLLNELTQLGLPKGFLDNIYFNFIILHYF